MAYHRLPLSFREVEELMLVRGVIVTYETIRQWCAKFGPVYAAGSLLISSGPLPEMDTSGVVTGPTVNWLLRVIDGCLRAEELDRREVDGSDR